MTEKISHLLFEGADTGVFSVDVVTNLRFGHRPTHGRRRLGEGVRAQVDHLANIPENSNG